MTSPSGTEQATPWLEEARSWIESSVYRQCLELSDLRAHMTPGFALPEVDIDLGVGRRTQVNGFFDGSTWQVYASLLPDWGETVLAAGLAYLDYAFVAAVTGTPGSRPRRALALRPVLMPSTVTMAEPEWLLDLVWRDLPWPGGYPQLLPARPVRSASQIGAYLRS